MRIFFDSSALVKRYVGETGSAAVLSWCDQASAMCLSGITLPEIISALCRLQRDQLITSLQYRQLKTLLLADMADAAVGDLTPEVLRLAIASLERSPLRGMDAIHIGSALALGAELFVSADARQCAAAAQAGLRVEQV